MIGFAGVPGNENGREYQFLQTVPGVKEKGAASVLAEVGPDMSQLGPEKNLSSWAGVCPGNNRSAGKNKGSKTTKGNRWLRATRTECAWAASGKKNCFLKQKFWRLATKNNVSRRRPWHCPHSVGALLSNAEKRATLQGTPSAVMDQKQRNRLIRHDVWRLGKLGIRVRPLAFAEALNA